jgi:hypothetical protein
MLKKVKFVKFGTTDKPNHITVYTHNTVAIALSSKNLKVLRKCLNKNQIALPLKKELKGIV